MIRLNSALPRLLQPLMHWRDRRARLRTAADLHRFLAEQTAFVAQKSVLEYCRARTGANWDKLRKEMGFRGELAVCRWQAFEAVLADLAVIVEGRLRPQVGESELALADWLADAAAAILAEHPDPPHRPEGWDGVAAALRVRLARAQMAAPLPAYAVGTISGTRIFEVLPIHPSLRRHDREMVVNSVRFALCRSHDDLCARLDATVAAEVAGRPPARDSIPPPQPGDPVDVPAVRE